jgi:hypothetical protein
MVTCSTSYSGEPIQFGPLAIGIAGGSAWVVWGLDHKMTWLGLSVGLFICCAATVLATIAFQVLWHLAFGGSSAYYVVRTFNLPTGLLEDRATHVQIDKHEATSGITTRFDDSVEAQQAIAAWAVGIGAVYVLGAIASMFIEGARWQ